MKLRVLDLFSGIGGFSLGLERTGAFETAAFCEINAHCRDVLARHWPDVPCFEDVTTLRGESVGTIDVICGGFPCQDISIAGDGAGLDGERSGLWREIARLVRELRPQLVLVENVAALLGRGFDRVLGDLAALGYSAWWRCIRASDVGARHGRDRVWIVAYPEHRGVSFGRRIASACEALLRSIGVSGDDAPRSQQQASQVVGSRPPFLGRIPQTPWRVEPGMGRVADGVPERVGQLRAYGNAVVPQIPELLGYAILESMREAA